MRLRVIALVLPVLLVVGVFVAPYVEGSADDLAGLAEKFAKQFLEGKHEDNLDLMTADMKAASGPGPSETLRSALIRQHGAVSGAGPAWHEDRVQGYTRYRVPVRFDQSTLDFRVVFDGEGRLAGFFIVPHAAPPEPDEAGPGKREEVNVGEGEASLPGTLVLPEGAGPFPAVVLIHGSGPNDRDETIGPNKPFRDLAWGLAERGIASLRYDKRSYARPDDLVAIGDGLTVQHEVIDDARAALTLLRAHEAIDGSRLFVVGHSLGGTLAPRIAAAEPRPAGIVSLGGSTLPIPEKVATQTRYIVGLDGKLTAEERKHLGMIEQAVGSLRAALDGEAPAPKGPILGAPFGYYEDLETYDPAAEAARLALPILVLQGRRDYQVTLEDFVVWQRALQDEAFACLVTYDGLDHLFRAGSGPSGPADYERQVPFEPRVIDDVAAWIMDRRCPTGQGNS